MSTASEQAETPNLGRTTTDYTKTGIAWAWDSIAGFKQAPNPDTLEVYAQSLLTCAGADGQLHEQEREWVLGRFAVIGASKALLDRLANFQPSESITELIKKDPVIAKHAPRALVYEALSACAADGVLHDKERATVLKLGAAMGLTESDLRQVVAAWDVTQAARRNMLAVLNPSGSPF